MPTLKGTEMSLSYIQCFLCLVSSSINASFFIKNAWISSGKTSYCHSKVSTNARFIIIVIQSFQKTGAQIVWRYLWKRTKSFSSVTIIVNTKSPQIKCTIIMLLRDMEMSTEIFNKQIYWFPLRSWKWAKEIGQMWQLFCLA